MAQPPFRDFRDLRVWQAALDLTETVYQVARTLPSDERFALADQLRRAAVSIPANIAEGWGRRSRGDFVRFVRVANGSLREVQTHILVALRLGVLRDGPASPALDGCDRVARLLTALERSLRR